MTVLVSAVLAATLGLVSTVAAHGYLSHVGADQVYPDVTKGDSVGWHTPGDPNPWVDQTMYNDPDSVCGRGYMPGPLHAKVAAGGQVSVSYAGWCANHRGAIVDYLADCKGPCNQIADKTKLEWVKVGQVGLVRPGRNEKNDLGFWATDQLYATSIKKQDAPGNGPDNRCGDRPTWNVTIPDTFAPGHYVLRHEIIALFVSPRQIQHYPRCVNLEVSGSGTDHPQGVVTSQLYDVDSMPGLKISLDDRPTSYELPGPPLYTASSSSYPLRGNGTTGGNGTTLATASSVASTGDASATAISQPAVTNTTSLGTTSDTTINNPSVTTSSGREPSASAASTTTGSDPCEETETVTVTVTTTVKPN